MDEITIDLSDTTLRDFLLSQNDGEYVIELALDGTVPDVGNLEQFGEPGNVRPVSIRLEIPSENERA